MPYQSADPSVERQRDTQAGVINQPAILSLFGAQYGMATSSQLLALGMSRRSITRGHDPAR